MKLFYLNVIKQHFKVSEVEQTSLDACEGASVQFTTASAVKALRISPDATACAVATVDGTVTFYILEGTS